MTQVSGSLKLVTGSPAEVSEVWLRAPKGRVQGTEYVTESPDTIQVTGGAVSFDALPGAMVMTLVSHGAPMHTVKLLVPDKTTATLAECIEAAELATDGTRSALERLALEIQEELGQVPSLVSDALAQDATIIEAVNQAAAIRKDTTVGTRIFIGNTMIYGDTGWRDITSLITPAPTSGQLKIRIHNGTVTLHAFWLAAPQGDLVANLPREWAPLFNSGGDFRNSSGKPIAEVRFTYGGILTIKKLDGGLLDSTMTYVAKGGWPTSYIGTPL